MDGYPFDSLSRPYRYTETETETKRDTETRPTPRPIKNKNKKLETTAWESVVAMSASQEGL